MQETRDVRVTRATELTFRSSFGDTNDTNEFCCIRSKHHASRKLQ